MRLIDADALNDAMFRKSFETDDGRQQWDGGLWIRYKVFEEARDEAPTIDAVSVVRCKDCIFAEQNVTISHSDSGDYTVTLCLADTIPKIVDNYYFCAGGESKRERKYNEID